MSNHIKFAVITNDKPLVIINWETFGILLRRLPKSLLIKIFADSTITEDEWRKLSKDDIITKIFIGYETSFLG